MRMRRKLLLKSANASPVGSPSLKVSISVSGVKNRKQGPKMTRTKIGSVGVDSGQLMIVDPCYIDSTWDSKPPKPNGHHSASYLEVMDATLGNPPYGPVLKYPRGVTGLGFAFSTYWGDGEYTIWETRNDKGELLKVEIELASETPPEDEDDEFDDEDDSEGGNEDDEDEDDDL